jgi:hypothetical protein
MIGVCELAQAGEASSRYRDLVEIFELGLVSPIH